MMFFKSLTSSFTLFILIAPFLIAVQYRVMENKVDSAFYKLTDPSAQMRSYVNDIIRSTIPTLDFDEALASKEDVAQTVSDRLESLMAEYGFEIITASVVGLDPDTIPAALRA